MASVPNDVIISVPEPEAHVLTSSKMRASIPLSIEFVKNPVLSSKNSNSLSRRNSSTNQKEASETGQKKDTNHDIFKDEEDSENQREVMNWKKFIVFMELIAFLIIMGVLIVTLEADKLHNSTIWDLKIWKWCLLLFSILCGRLISYLLTEIIMSFIWKLCLNEKVLYFAHGVRKSFIFSLWLGLVTLSWRLMFNHNEAQRKTSRALAGFLIGSGLWLIKTVFLKLIASLHTTKLFEKIKEDIRLRKVLKNVLEMKAKPKDTTVSKKVEKVSKETMKELMDAIRGKGLQPLSFDCESCRKKHEINDDAKARIAAEDVFKKLAAGSTSDGYMDWKKLKRFLEDDKVIIQHFLDVAEDKSTPAENQPNNTDEDDKVIIHHFLEVAEDKSTPAGNQHNNTDEDDNKKIKRSVFRSWVVDIYKDHESLRSTLKHNKTAIDELNVIVSVIVMFTIIVVWFLFMGFLTIKILVFLSSQLLLAVFMFGNTVKTIFEAIILVFVVHPFDIGDRCVVDGVQMVVDEMNILTTTFLRYDGEKIYYPNAVLSKKPISNLYRSPPMTDCLEFAISIRTTEDVIDELQDKIRTYLEGNPRRWRPEHSVQFKEIENVNKMKMVVYVNHTVNFHYFMKRAKRRSDFVLKMKRIFEDLRVEYSLLPQQVNLVASVTSATGSLPARPWHLSPYL